MVETAARFKAFKGSAPWRVDYMGDRTPNQALERLYRETGWTLRRR
jgi:hypothetical protein